MCSLHMSLALRKLRVMMKFFQCELKKMTRLAASIFALSFLFGCTAVEAEPTEKELYEDWDLDQEMIQKIEEFNRNMTAYRCKG